MPDEPSVGQPKTAEDTGVIANPARMRTRRQKILRSLVFWMSAIILAVLIGSSRYQLIWTSTGPLLVAKDRFTFAESFASLKAVTDNPDRYPLTYVWLTNAGIVTPLGARPPKAHAVSHRSSKSQEKGHPRGLTSTMSRASRENG